eukprot:CAMPEP_0201721072 /NCGR_PEP_ID=MMETSP0593-20130828/5851_1 /ASSEMBLY_ACC=CAM_ASM_000672 /TAXON_ID=267983 /ORGANISM="Skeletonema japonicum, Strain CCMP2506" /LENGTH=414 /DNA_ID=CAMNT_0048211817 /DNA_START=71 /DNA_END=1315 /DNA_ORIENTATION=-
METSSIFSGLENEGMRDLTNTLKIQPTYTYEPNILELQPARVVCCMDGAPSKNVNFRGCKIIRLLVSADSSDVTTFPVNLTIAGPCYYTKEDKKDFEIMMRTREQSLLMKLPYISKFDWPDYRAIEQCPKCCKRQKPSSSGTRYWLVYQQCIQCTEIGVGTRMMPRLMCEECFESITDEFYVSVVVGSGFEAVGPETIAPLLDVIEDQGPITWLQNGQRLANHVDGTFLGAYKLYCAWEYSGAFQAMCDEIGRQMQSFLGDISGNLGFEYNFVGQQQAPPSTYWEMSQIPDKEGRVCDYDGCANVHGKRVAPKPGKKKGKKTRLQECLGCFDVMYCSEDCQKAAWPDHKAVCKEAQRKRKEEEEKGKARQKIDAEEKMAAALASFVPLSITPQGGGGKKKKGKKGGAKKKKGKK